MADFRIKISDGSVTIDLQGGSDSFLREAGMMLPRPQLNQSLITNPDTDGVSLANAHFGARQITLSVKILGSTLSDLKTNVRTINRLLNDAEERTLSGFGAQVFLEYQWGNTAGESVFFDILRGDLVMPGGFMQAMLGKSFVIPNATITLTTQPFGRFANQIESTQTLDNSQGNRLIIDSYLVDNDATHNVSEAAWEGQTFAATSTYTATGAAFKFARSTSAAVGVVSVEIYATTGGAGSEEPTGSALASGTFTLGATSPLSTRFGWGPVDFASGVVLTSGVVYAVVISETGTGSPIWAVDTTAGFADGHRVFSADSGGTWTVDATDDFLFAVYSADTKTNYQDVTVDASYGDVPSRMAVEVCQNNGTGSQKTWMAKMAGARQSDALWFEGEDADSFTNIIGGAHIVEGTSTGVPDLSLSGDFSKQVSIVPTGAAIAANTEVARFNFDIPTATLPRGQFRVLVRVKTESDDNADFDHMSWGFGYSYGGITKTPTEANSEYFQVAADGTYEILDLGVVNIPPIAESTVAANDNFQLRIFQYATEELTQNELYQMFTDFVFLLPLDEGTLIVDDVAADDFLLADGITRPNNVFLLAQEEAPHFTGVATSNMSAGAIHNAAAKLWQSVWFKLDTAFSAASSADNVLTGKRIDGSDFLISFLQASDGKLVWWLQTGGGTSFRIASTQTSWNAGQWYHVILSISSANGVRLIVDNGTAVTDADTTAAPNGGDVVYASQSDGGINGHVGIIANIVLGTDDLTTDEEEGLFNGVIPADANNIWLMDEGTGVTVADTGTDGNPGTLDAAVTWENHIRVNGLGIQDGTIASFPDYVGNPFSLGREDTRVYVLRDDDDTVTLPTAIERQPQFFVT